MTDSGVKRLRALIERPERCGLWGREYVVTPRLIARAIGDGKQLVCVTPLAHRPNYFVARVDSTMKHVLDDAPGQRQGAVLVLSYLDEIIEAAEEEYGYHGDEQYQAINGDETRPFPVCDWGVGATWGKPFPVNKWKPAPPISKQPRLR